MTKDSFEGFRSVVQFQPKPLGIKGRLLRGFAKDIYAKLVFRKTRPLFILGAMRSGSTLLSHLLMSHPEVFGVGESHVVWRDRASFFDVAAEAIRLRREFPAARTYLLDKILHSHLTPNLGALTSISGTKIIVLLRRPSENISSISEMGDVVKAGGVPVAVEEYCRRMEDLDHILNALDHPSCLLVEYERLTADPDAVLQDIQTFLDLRAPLGKEYKLNRVSGRWGYGDGSDNIRQGTIVAKERRTSEIPAEALKDAERLYEQVRMTALKLQGA